MSPPLPPITPQHRRDGFRSFLDTLNERYGLQIPIPQDWSPVALGKETSPLWAVFKGLRILYYGHRPVIEDILANFDEWIAGAPETRTGRRDERVQYLRYLIRDQMYFLKNNPSFSNKRVPEYPTEKTPDFSTKKRRNSDEDDEEYYTAPNSPVKRDQPITPDLMQLDISEYGEPSFRRKTNGAQTKRAPTFMEKLTASRPAPRNEFMKFRDAPPPASDAMDTSFSTVTSSISFASHSTRLGDSFATDITEPIETQSTYADDRVGMFIEREMNMIVGKPAPGGKADSLRDKLVAQLLRYGPFSIDQPFSEGIPLRCRYELERIGRAWNIPLDQMLKSLEIYFAHDRFWALIQGHDQRGDRLVPENSPCRAWDAAAGDFKTGRHSEVVVMTGDLDWCAKNEPGIFKLRLNPLRLERTCRFYRRFGSDRFLTLTIPAAARPPDHLRFDDQAPVLRESIAAWLTRNDHYCLGRVWRAFFVEEVKSKKKLKADPRFRVECFAIDGVDFLHRSIRTSIAPPHQASDKHTPMSVEDLLEWHMPTAANRNQSDCKLFQRISLGLSKTFASVVIPRTSHQPARHSKTRHERWMRAHVPEPGKADL